MRCYGCGGEGHIEPNCPNAELDSTGRLPWCGFCDERTRLVFAGDIAARCQQCNPRRHKHLRQHRKCPACHMTIYEWDNAPCGHHKSPGITADTRPPKEHLDAIITSHSGEAA